MKKLLIAVALAVFSLAQSPAFAQDKNSDPTKEESKKAVADPNNKAAADPAKKAASADDAKKSESTDAKKDPNKKKVKKGGC